MKGWTSSTWSFLLESPAICLSPSGPISFWEAYYSVVAFVVRASWKKKVDMGGKR